MENIVRRRYWWFALSLLIIVPGAIFLIVYGLKPGIDFAGGALWDIQFLERQRSLLNTDDVARVFAAQGFDGAVVQFSEVTIQGKTVPSALVRTKALSTSNPEEQQQNVLAALQAKYGKVQRESVQSVGGTVSAESTRSAVIA